MEAGAPTEGTRELEPSVRAVIPAATTIAFAVPLVLLPAPRLVDLVQTTGWFADATPWFEPVDRRRRSARWRRLRRTALSLCFLVTVTALMAGAVSALPITGLPAAVVLLFCPLFAAVTAAPLIRHCAHLSLPAHALAARLAAIALVIESIAVTGVATGIAQGDLSVTRHTLAVEQATALSSSGPLESLAAMLSLIADRVLFGAGLSIVPAAVLLVTLTFWLPTVVALLLDEAGRGRWSRSTPPVVAIGAEVRRRRLRRSSEGLIGVSDLLLPFRKMRFGDLLDRSCASSGVDVTNLLVTTTDADPVALSAAGRSPVLLLLGFSGRGEVIERWRTWRSESLDLPGPLSWVAQVDVPDGVQALLWTATNGWRAWGGTSRDAATISLSIQAALSAWSADVTPGDDVNDATRIAVAGR